MEAIELEPNLSEYSLDELRDTLNIMDEEAFPERAAKLKQELESRELSSPICAKAFDGNFDYNEKFYACPSCESKIGLFSKTMNTWGQVKTCPHCDEPFKITTNFKFLAYTFVPAIFLHFFLLKPLIVAFGASSSISIAIVVVLSSLLSKRLTKVQSKNGT